MTAIVLAILITLPATAANTAVNYAVPDRYSLSVIVDIPYDVARYSGKELVDVNGNGQPGAINAIFASLAQFNRGGKPYSWVPISDCADAIDHMLKRRTPAAFRRWAVYELFNNCSGTVSSRLTLDPEDRNADLWWARFDALRVRGLKDADLKLGESFERFAEDPLAPRWKEAKKDAEAARGRLLAARPDLRSFLDETFGYLLSMEESLLSMAARSRQALDGRPLQKSKRLEQLKDIETSLADHRLRCDWTNVLPHAVIDKVGNSDARRYGFIPQPIRLAWPKNPSRN